MTLKLTASIPWLYVVPFLAVLVEWGLGPRLPYSLGLMFLAAFFFTVAHITYTVACPSNLKGIGSQDEWSKLNASKRLEIVSRLEQDKTLKASLLGEAERLIDESLNPEFNAEQIRIIKRELLIHVRGKTSFYSEAMERVVETSIATFKHLDKEKALARWTCSLLIASGFCLLGAVAILRLLSVYHATLR